MRGSRDYRFEADGQAVISRMCRHSDDELCRSHVPNVLGEHMSVSRLPSTTHVFSLTFFSIEVFGLPPEYRRYLRHISWQGHLFLALAWAMGAGASPRASWSASKEVCRNAL